MTNTKLALDEIDYIELLSEDWRILRVRFGSMCSYFFYAEVQVLEYEAERKNSPATFEPTKHHSCAIAAYGHMRSCLRFLKDIADSSQIDIRAYEKWILEVIDKRDRLQAHPNEKHGNRTIMVHESIVDGEEIRFPLWNQYLRKAEDRIYIEINTRKDLGTLAELLEIVSEQLLNRYRKGRESKPHLLKR